MVIATAKGDVHHYWQEHVGVVLRRNNYEIVDFGVMVPAEKILRTAREVNADSIGLFRAYHSPVAGRDGQRGERDGAMRLLSRY